MAGPFLTPFPRRNLKHQRQEQVPTHTFTPRTYQVELVDLARQRNTIVCLGNVAGKTFITTMLIKELSHQVRPDFDENGKRSLVLVNSDDIVRKEADIVSLHTDLSVGSYGLEANHWSATRWQQEFTHNHVLIMNGITYLHIMRQGWLVLTSINLLVFDDCHLASDPDHPFQEVIQAYNELDEGSQPRILGLTMSVLNNRCTTPKMLEESLGRLEKTLHATAETATDMVIPDLYGAKPQEMLVQCDNYEDHTGLVEVLGGILDSAIEFLEDRDAEDDDEDCCCTLHTALMEVFTILHTMGPWCAGQAAEAISKQLVKLEAQEDDMLQKGFLNMALTKLRLIEHVATTAYDNCVQSLDDFLLYMSPKVLELVIILRTYKPDDNFMIIGEEDLTDNDFLDGAEISDDSDFTDDDETFDIKEKGGKGSKPPIHYVAVRRTVVEGEGGEKKDDEDDSLCGVVFVDRKHTAYVLNKLVQELCNWDADLFFVQSHHITVPTSRRFGSREAEHIFRRQEEILRKFRNKDINLLISTGVLEEGVDLPKCNLVVRFDLPRDYRSYVLSKGRARMSKSKFYMLVDESQAGKYSVELQTFRGIEKILLNKCQEEENEEEELKEEDKSVVDKLLPPYCPSQEEDGATVKMSTAIALVNKYCAKLPSDAFTHLTPKCTLVEVPGTDPVMHKATLQLPINSPIKEPIRGEVMSSRRMAKMAVALSTCKILHKAGELDMSLNPVGKEVVKYEDEEGEWEEQEAQGQPRPGTTKRKQYYQKKVAEPLLGQPKPNCPAYLYIVDMQLTCPITEEQNTRGRKIHPPEETPRCFGIISEKKIPKTPMFPVFTRSGEVTVSIDLLCKDLHVTEDELELLRTFHHVVFSRVLRLEKDPMMFNPEEAESCYIIVPLNRDDAENIVIDWQFVNMIEDCPIPNKRKQLFDQERDSFMFVKDQFEDAVVMPSYRNIDQPQYFYVAEIRHDLNPKSAFPSPELYDTFQHYYNSKYGLQITNLDQPLLDVDHTSARLNLLTPRYMNQKGMALPTSSAETRKARRENLQQKQILVPELCDVHPFPASLWRKAVCLPAILYRMNCLLISEEIRQLIARGAHIGVVCIPEEFRFPQLEFGFSTKPTNGNGVKETDEEDDENNVHADRTDDKSKEGVEEVAVDKEMCSCSCDGQTGTQELSRTGDELDKTPQTEVLVKTEAEPVENNSVGNVETRAGSLGNASTMSPLTVNVITEDELTAVGKGIEGILLSPSHLPQLEDGCMSSARTSVSSYHTAKESISPVSPPPSAGLEGPHGDNRVDDDIWLHQPDCQTQGRKTDNPSTNSASSADKPQVPPTYTEQAAKLETESVSTSQTSLTAGQFKTTESSVNGCTQSNVCDKSSDIGSNCCASILKADANVVSEFNDVIKPHIDFDEESDLQNFVGPSPCTILQTLTMSNANDFFNLERLETIGDSFLKFAITVYLYCSYPGIHEGKLSYLRSKQVSNYNLYKLGKKKAFPNCMVAAKFEPTENWLPPGFIIKKRDAYSGLDVFVIPEEYKKGGKETKENGLKEDGNENKEVDLNICETNGVTGDLKSVETKTDLITADEQLNIPDSNTVHSNIADESVSETDQKDKSPNIESTCSIEQNKVKCVTLKGKVEMVQESSKVFNGHLETSEEVVSQPSCNGVVEENVAMETQMDDNVIAMEDVKSKPFSIVLEAKNIDTTTEEGRFAQELEEYTRLEEAEQDDEAKQEALKCLIPYNLQTQHSLPDKSIADCVEALIGCYLTTCGQKAALLFMSWLGLKVLPSCPHEAATRLGSGKPHCKVSGFGNLHPPPSPLLTHVPDAVEVLNHQLDGYTAFEEHIQYQFRDRAYLLQAFTHASYHYNSVTDCYQRLEFLGDAILDYVITRHVFEDSKKHSPGVLTDLRSALVNNNIFAALAVKWDFHKYFKALSPQLFHVIDKFVTWQKARQDKIDLDEEFNEIEDKKEEEGEDIEIPKALGDIFESVAGAIYLDSGMSLDTVWKVYYRMMKPQIDAFTAKIPKSPVRELLEMEPETAKFEKPERTLEGKIRVTVNVVGKGKFRGVGRNYRIAKSAAAKRALKFIKVMQQQINAGLHAPNPDLMMPSMTFHQFG